MQMLTRAQIPGVSDKGNRCAGLDLVPGGLEQLHIVLVDGHYVILVLNLDGVAIVLVLQR